ncbi:MAG: hypothetical protein Q8N03_07105 [Ignavibacteria bacterium]|jgi:hypothetical protein|nr:hypothetical protein [Ignavibacteria bacterium]
MITEREIFNYIFYRERVTDKIISEIVTNKLYDEAVHFYSELKNEIVQNVSLEEKKALVAKIPIYKFIRKYELLPVTTNNSYNHMRLAACSEDNEARVTTTSFFSETKEFLCRIVSTPTQKLLYCFSTGEEELRECSLTLQPGGANYICKFNSDPLEIKTDMLIEKIVIEVL